MSYKWPYSPNHIYLYFIYLNSLHMYFFQMYDPCFRRTIHITYCPVVTETGETTQGKTIKPRDFCSFQRQNISLSKCDCCLYKFFAVSMKARADRPLFAGVADKSDSLSHTPTNCTRWTVLWLPLPPKSRPPFLPTADAFCSKQHFLALPPISLLTFYNGIWVINVNLEGTLIWLLKRAFGAGNHPI